jgi:3-hydroxyisobutyrate dehydrogenase
MSELQNVGYIGLGNIGKPSARRLIGQSWRAHVYDVYRPAVDELAGLGAVGCGSVTELARACDHIGVCVRDAGQVEDLLYGEGGLLQNARPGTLVAIHSTVTRNALLRWAQDAAQRQLTLIDAAITGGAAVAEAGTLCYLVGGSAEAVARATPVFMTSGDKIVHAGDLGAGMLLKLCNNMMTYAEYMAMSEATRLAEAGGLTADLLYEVGQTNGVVNAGMHRMVSNRNKLAKTCTEEQMEQFFGSFGRLGEKDLECALATAAEMGVELPTTARLRDVVYDMFMNRA